MNNTPKQMTHTIYLTEKDYERLHSLVQVHRLENNRLAVEALGRGLKRAKVVPSEEIPEDVVTMNSLIRLKEMSSLTEMELSVVYPKDADLNQRKISVLAPVGTAILGCRVGDEVEWPTPKGARTYKVMDIIYQPEAAGDVYL
ncbi:nucleoside diphosphate kinase regulator [Pontibacter kalidii]|uniref:nucleoside diphosphate kinase regulator n=1 Tax=Pontibacter kalidii TaxID=2592049 RepID=UPI002255872F|nr:nucleoside diphosphate kinase regulator [Pontibacter kalidii]